MYVFVPTCTYLYVFVPTCTYHVPTHLLKYKFHVIFPLSTSNSKISTFYVLISKQNLTKPMLKNLVHTLKTHKDFSKQKDSVA